MQTLEDYATAYCAKDIDALMRVFVDADDISPIGTGGNELCAGRDAVRREFVRNFDAATARRFEWQRSHISVSGDFSVVDMSLTIHLDYRGDDLKVPIRWTVALKKDRGRWAWMHRPASAPASRQQAGQACPGGSGD